jgi:hypothetical protein
MDSCGHAESSSRIIKQESIRRTGGDNPASVYD